MGQRRNRNERAARLGSLHLMASSFRGQCRRVGAPRPLSSAEPRALSRAGPRRIHRERGPKGTSARAFCQYQLTTSWKNTHSGEGERRLAPATVQGVKFLRRAEEEVRAT